MKKYDLQLQLITLLADGQFHSGEELGKQMQMTRAGINKHMQALKKWGLEYSSVPGKGYCLENSIELIDSLLIQQAVAEQPGKVILKPVIDSTNRYLLDPTTQAVPGDVCIAEYQYAGRGRRGREWYSPFGGNICFSLFWQFAQGHAAASGLSLMVGVVVAQVLQQMGMPDVRVKWPNDIYVKDRKLAGILVELSGKMGDIVNLVVGVGMNLFLGKQAEQRVATPYIDARQMMKSVGRNQLLIHLIKALRSAMEQFEQHGLAPFIDQWNKLDNFINKPVKLLIGEQTIHGISRGIDELGALLLEQEGEIHRFVGGEISLRPAS
ncbi:MAG: bifunctional biotin--[acetyl-CoA-carboxylase] ligase/biotin operon repressor BirA [Enterobacteriaceae bacterium]